MNQEKKEAVKEIAKKMSATVSDDIKSVDVKGMKNPVMIGLLVLAGLGVSKDPMILLYGALVILGFAAFKSVGKDDLSKLMSKNKNQEQEAAQVEARQEKVDPQ